jgi:methylation protein EvaC
VADDGIVSVEVPYVGDLLARVEYDTVYHEHLSYFSIQSLLVLCDRARLSVLAIDRLPVHGGSLRVWLTRVAVGHAPAVYAMARDEARRGLLDAQALRAFADGVATNRADLISLLERLTASGKTVVGYGAAAKATTRLNYCGIGIGLLPYTVDRNPLKVGRYMPGTHIPIRSVAALTSSPVPDYVLILAWNLADEVMAQERVFRARGGQFILPVPEPRIVP